MFLPDAFLSVCLTDCLSVCLSVSRVTEMLLTTFDGIFGKLWCVARLYFDEDPDHVALRLGLGLQLPCGALR